MSDDRGTALKEADRLMTICNACRYCEGLCAVFPAMERRRSFGEADLNFLANLCHGCGACYVDCQFAAPHEFNVNVPKTMAIVRANSYEAYAWPRSLAPLLEHNGLVISLILALSVAMFIILFIGWHDPAVLFAVRTGPGAFYQLMPHGLMVGIFGAAFLYALLALTMSVRRFWRDLNDGSSGQKITLHVLKQAFKDMLTLRYLDGGGVGCYGKDDKPDDDRRFYHHLTFYGFFLCFAATSVATLYHDLLSYQAPYPWYDLPVLLGTAGGMGLIIGPLGLLRAKWTRDPALQDGARTGMDVAFLLLLFLTALTGLLLLFLRATPAMGLLLALHLGVVFGFFITMPYSKFVHGFYRLAALIHDAREQHRA